MVIGMKLSQLKYFLAVAEEGRITSAAAKLHMSQPPLSQQLKQLEDTLGVRLFDRSGKGVELTAAGRLLYSRGSQILELVEHVDNELKDFAHGTLGTVHIGVISSAVSLLLNFGLPEFCAANPRVSYNVMENDTFSVLDMLDRAVIEVAFVRTPFSSNGYNVFPILSEPVVALAGSNYPFQHQRPARGEVLSLEELEGEKLVLLQNYENTVMTACRRQGVEPSVICRCSNAITALMCTRAGIGIMVTPQNMLDMAENRDLLVWNVECATLVSSVCMVWKADRELSNATQRFIGHIKAQYQKS